MQCEICDKEWFEECDCLESRLEEIEYIKQYGRCSWCVEEYGTILYPDQC